MANGEGSFNLSLKRVGAGGLIAAVLAIGGAVYSKLLEDHDQDNAIKALQTRCDQIEQHVDANDKRLDRIHDYILKHSGENPDDPPDKRRHNGRD